MLRLAGMHGNDPRTIGFPADARAIGVALAEVRAFAEAQALSADALARLAIVVEELVANLVEHGGAEGSPVVLALARRPHEIALTLIDRGLYFDPRAAPATTSIPERGGGAGIALLLAWTRITCYARVDGANRLDLTLPLKHGD